MQETLLKYLYKFLTEERKVQFEKVLSKRTNHFTIGLEDVFHSHNANAIIRSCDCFGIQRVHIAENKHTFSPSRNVSKGAIKWVDMVTYETSANAIQSLKEDNYQIVATSPHDKNNSIYDFDISKKSAFFFGAEKKGISKTVKEQADALISIPMLGHTESLNVSVSVAILIQYLTHKLRNSNLDWQLPEKEKNELKLDWAKKSIKNSHIHEKRWRKLNENSPFI